MMSDRLISLMNLIPTNHGGYELTAVIWVKSC